MALRLTAPSVFTTKITITVLRMARSAKAKLSKKAIQLRFPIRKVAIVIAANGKEYAHDEIKKPFFTNRLAAPPSRSVMNSPV